MAPGGVLPPKKTAMALLAAHRRLPINFSGQSDNDWTDDVSSTIRATFSKYRDLAGSTEAARRCFAKASVQERAAVLEVLSKMGARTIADESGPPTPLALMDRKESGSFLDSVEHDVVDFKSLGCIFAKISNDLDNIDEMAAETPRSMEMNDTPRSTASTTFYPPTNVSVAGCSEAELEAQLLELANCSEPLPPKSGGQKLIATQAKIKAKADKKAAKAKAKAKSRSKVAIKTKAMKELKRPAAATADENDLADTPVKKPPTTRKPGAEPSSSEKTAAPAPTTSNNAELKKLHSKMYHRACQEALRDGKSEEDARATGREAGRQAINEFVLSAE